MTLFIITTLEFLCIAAFAYYVFREGKRQKAERSAMVEREAATSVYVMAIEE